MINSKIGIAATTSLVDMRSINGKYLCSHGDRFLGSSSRIEKLIDISNKTLLLRSCKMHYDLRYEIKKKFEH